MSYFFLHFHRALRLLDNTFCKHILSITGLPTEVDQFCPTMTRFCMYLGYAFFCIMSVYIATYEHYEDKKMHPLVGSIEIRNFKPSIYMDTGRVKGSRKYLRA